jgi:hypothetical protein
MSTGNMTFHFPTKDHMLAELVNILCRYQKELMEDEAKDGGSSVMAICLELLTIASACEQDEVAKDFFLSTYRSELCMDLIRKSDKARAKEVFKEYCSDWTDEQFRNAESLVVGIEYSTLNAVDESVRLEARITGALNTIMTIYNVPEEIRKKKIEKVIALNYRNVGKRIFKEFKEYIEQTTEQAFDELLE